MKHGYGSHSYGKMSSKGGGGGSREMSNVKKSDGKVVTAGRGTIHTPFNKAVIRNVGRGR